MQHVNQPFKISITNIFADEDNEQITMRAFLKLQFVDLNQVKTKVFELSSNSNYWLKFSPEQLLFTGSPVVSDIQFNPVIEKYDQNFTVLVRGYDRSDYYAESSFILRVVNFKPEVREPSFSYQFYSVVGKMQVLMEFKMIIDRRNVRDPDSDAITFKMFMQNKDNTIISLPKWVNFDEYSLMFTGKPPSSERGKNLTFVLQATDGIFVVNQYLQVKPQISLLYLVLLAGQIAGPLTFAFGLLNYKGIIYGICCKKKYKQQRPITVYHGQRVQIVFPLIQEKMNYMLHIINEMRTWMWGAEFIDPDTFKIKNVQKFQEEVNAQLPAYKSSYLQKQLINQHKDEPTYHETYWTFNFVLKRPNYYSQSAATEEEQLSDESQDTNNTILNALIYQEIIQKYLKAYIVYLAVVREAQNKTRFEWFYHFVYDNIVYAENPFFNIFPVIHVNRVEVEKIMEDVLRNDEGTLNQLKVHQIQAIDSSQDMYVKDLIMQNIAREAYGLQSYTFITNLRHSYGLSINTKEEDITLIDTKYIDNEEDGCMIAHCSRCWRGFKRYLRLDMQSMPLQQMQRLPNWLKVKVENDAIIFQGLVPSKLTLNNYIILIYSSAWICKEFQLLVEHPLRPLNTEEQFKQLTLSPSAKEGDEETPPEQFSPQALHRANVRKQKLIPQIYQQSNLIYGQANKTNYDQMNEEEMEQNREAEAEGEGEGEANAEPSSTLQECKDIEKQIKLLAPKLKPSVHSIVFLNQIQMKSYIRDRVLYLREDLKPELKEIFEQYGAVMLELELN